MTLDLDAIEARAQAATPGPWEEETRTISQHWSRPEPWLDVVTDEVSCGSYCIGGTCAAIVRQEDATFIAHAREDIPALIDYLHELEAEIAHRTTAAAAGMTFEEYMGRLSEASDELP